MLYIVATPIGNLKEITFRAVEVLKSVHLILAEDTRRSSILFKEYGITANAVSYQKFNERGRTQQVIELLSSGRDVALISDAGMPLVSDPGSVLMQEVIARGLAYTVISGACAAINAAVLSGMDLTSFCMVGFLPEKNIDRDRYLQKFEDLQSTLIFYISPHSAKDDMDYIFARLGARKAALVREISKLHEEVIHFNLGAFPKNEIRGELVLVVEGAPPKTEGMNELPIMQHYEHYINQGYGDMDAVKKVASDRKVAKNIVYAQIKKKEQD